MATYNGTSGNDTYNGTIDPDFIYGLGGDDILRGADGNDTIDGGAGADTLVGGDGNDILYSTDGSDKLLDGGAGDDTIALGAVTVGGNVIVGGGGVDTLQINNNVVFSMARFIARDAGLESMYNLFGYSITGTADANRFDFSGITVTQQFGAVLNGLGGDDVLIGTAAYDVFRGGDDNDTLLGNAGGDSLSGEAGNDNIQGGDGADGLNGGTGDDTINGGIDNDNIVGDTGNDTLVGGDGDDSLEGGDDDDSMSGGVGNDTIFLYTGIDTLADGGTGDDNIVVGNVTINAGVLIGGTGTDLLSHNGNATLAMNRFVATESGFESIYNLFGFSFSGTATANRFDFSGLTVTSQFGAVLNGLGGDDVLIGTVAYDVFRGGDDNDTLLGNAGGDSLSGEAGNDNIQGGDGADGLNGGIGDDTINGGIDNDNLVGDTGADTLIGGDGDDSLEGGGDDDSMAGGVGNDTIFLYTGIDTLADGGTGDDNIVVGNVTINAGVLIGGTGTDLLSHNGNATLAMNRFVATESGFESIYNLFGYSFSGTATANRFDFSGLTVTSQFGAVLNGLGGDDVLIGTAAYDVFRGGDDNDTLLGNAGGDSLSGEAGNDNIQGGDGADGLNGGTGDDSINGGIDNDTLQGDTGNDTLVGGDGDDSLDGGADDDSMSGGVGNDTIFLYTGIDTLADGGTGDDNIVVGNVTINAGVLIGGTGTDLLSHNGNATLAMNRFVATESGFESIYNLFGYSFSGTATANRFDFSGLTVTSQFGAVLNGLGGDDVLIGTAAYDVFRGGDDNDTLLGNAGGDSLSGEAGNDNIQGGDGADGLNGGIGDDTIDGGTENDNLVGDIGDDRLIGGGGNDSLDGGAGIDRMSGDSGNDILYVYDGSDTLVDGGADDDNIVIGAVTLGADVLVGGDGTDLLTINNNATFTRFVASAAGFENYYNLFGYTISGTADANLLDFSGLTATSQFGAIVDGLSGNDTIIGMGFADRLTGGEGDDRLEGGNGDDTIAGGNGTDVALYIGASSAVTVSLLLNGQQNTSGAGLDTLTSIEGLVGSRFNDTLIGDINANTLVGGNGADRLEGGDGADILEGGAARDTLIGGAARDIAVYSAAWVDFDVAGSGSAYTVTDRRSESPDANDTLQTIEALRFSNGTFAIADTINVGPNGVADAAQVIEAGIDGDGTPIVTGNVLANDTDANLLTVGLGEILSVVSVGGTAISGATVIEGIYGTLTINRDGSYSYDLANRSAAVQALRAGDTATDTFTYMLTDAHGLTSSATLAIDVLGASDTKARDDLLQVTIGRASSLDASVLLGNDAFAEGTTITGISNAVGATVQIVDGKLVIVAGGATGSFDYTLTALNGETSTGHVDLAGVTYARRAILVADPAATAVDFVGGSQADELTGGAGMDRLVGAGGNDRLDGGAGDDVMDGGAGKDRYVVDSQGDRIVELSGGGADTVVATANVYVLDANVETLTFVGAGDFTGTGNASANTITGGAGVNILSGGDGNDTLVGGIGNDTFDGGNNSDTVSYANISAGVNVDLRIAIAQQTVGGGIDTLSGVENVTGGRGADTLLGSDSGNTLRGGGQKDVIAGNGGNDRISGDGAADTLTGGGGADTFLYAAIDEFGPIDKPEAITDFNAAQRDLIDLSVIDTDAVTEGDQGFTFIGASAFTVGGAAFELRVQDNGNGTFTVQGDVNHDGAADFALVVTSSITLVEADFAL